LPPARALDPVPNFGTAPQVAQGAEVWQVHCVMCHETQFGNRGLFPNLLVSPMLNSADAFRQVVIEGVLEPRGMVSFRGRIAPEDAEAVRAYLTQRANEQLVTQRAAAPPR
jgi:quinohemoprotein ethanol dehydrogenase